MMQKLQAVLSRKRKQGPRRTTRFNGPLLDQRREEVFIALYRVGLLR